MGVLRFGPVGAMMRIDDGKPTSRGLPPACRQCRRPVPSARSRRRPAPSSGGGSAAFRSEWNGRACRRRQAHEQGPAACGPAVPAASAVGDVFTHPSPTSRGLGCFVSFLSGGRVRTRRTAHEQGPSACGVLGDGRRGDERRSPKRDSQGIDPLSGCGQSPPFSLRDGGGMRQRREGTGTKSRS